MSPGAVMVTGGTDYDWSPDSSALHRIVEDAWRFHREHGFGGQA